MNDLLAILEKSTSTNHHELASVRIFLENLLNNDYETTICKLSLILKSIKYSPVVRMQAGLQLKNVIFSNVLEDRLSKQSRWLSIPRVCRNDIKTNCVLALGTELYGYHSAAQCVAYIACIEIPANEWPNIISLIVNYIIEIDASELMKQACLEVLGFLCNEIDTDFLENNSNEILTGILHGIKMCELSNKVRLTAIYALLNALELARNHFSIEGQRNYLMQIVCESSQSEDNYVSTASLQCLMWIMSQYYDYMEPYMERALFGITMAAMESEYEGKVLQAIEFWSSVCEIELDMESKESFVCCRAMRTFKCKQFGRVAAMFIMPRLLKILVKEDSNKNDWGPHKATVVCMSLFAKCCKDAIVHLVLPFIKANIGNEDWRKRDAAVTAFAAIIEGPSRKRMMSVVKVLMVRVTSLLADKCSIVRETAAWATGRVCDVYPEVALAEVNIDPLVRSLLDSLLFDVRVATNICWAFASLADAAAKLEKKSYNLRPFISEIMSNLLMTADRCDNERTDQRSAAHSAIAAMVKSAHRDCYECVRDTATFVIDRLQRSVSVINDECESPWCDTLRVIVTVMHVSDLVRVGDCVVALLLAMVERAQSSPNAFLALGAVVDSLGRDSLVYLSPVMTAVTMCITASVSDAESRVNAVAVVGDFARHVGDHLEPCLKTIMSATDSLIKGSHQNHSMIAAILAMYGDLSLHCGHAFSVYHSFVLTAVMSVCHVDDDDDVSVTVACIDTLVSVVHANVDSRRCIDIGAATLISQHLSWISDLIVTVTGDSWLCHRRSDSDHVIGSCCALIGDIASIVGIESLPFIDTLPITAVLDRARLSKNESVKQHSLWAHARLRRLRS